MSTKRTNKKMLAARILCGLLLGAYLTGGYCMPVAATPAGDGATIQGATVDASGTYATAFGYKTKASGYGSTAFGGGTKAEGNYSTAFGLDSIASGVSSLSFGYWTTASGYASTAFGHQSEASGAGATAWGGYWNSDEDNAKGGTASGIASTAFGIASEAKAKNSLAALGGIVDTAATNSAAIGNGAKVTVADTVALGSDSVASREKGATDAYLKGSNTGNAWVSTRNAIAVGDADNDVTRQITGVAAGSKDTDAVNVAQLKAARAETSKTLSLMQNATADLQALTAGFPEGKTIKETMDEELDTKANKDMDNLTEAGKTAVKDLAKEAVNVVGEGPVSVVKSDVSGVDTYKVSVKTDGKVESGDTGIVTGGKVYDYLHGDTISLGKGSEATGTQSIAIGYGNKVSGSNSGAFGDPNTVSGSGSYAIGNNNTISGDNTFVLGSNVKTGAKNAVVLGNGSEGADNAVSVGAKGKERQIKNVADGTDDTDVTTVKQVKEMIEAGGGGADLAPVYRRINDVDSKVNKIGAGAAALAALHPMDSDGKFSMAAGFGNYRDANAMALGVFYRPNDKVMFSMGGSLGNGENLLNVGVSFALDKGVTTSKAAMARKINALEEENKAIRAENAEQKAEIQELKEALARIEAKLAK